MVDEMEEDQENQEEASCPDEVEALKSTSASS